MSYKFTPIRYWQHSPIGRINSDTIGAFGGKRKDTLKKIFGLKHKRASER